MRLWPRRRRPQVDLDMDAALWEADRALSDAQAQGRYAEDLGHRAEEVRDRWRDTHDHNHVAEAFVETIMRRVRHQ